MTITREEAFFQFLEIIKTVWGEDSAKLLNITLGTDEPITVTGGQPALAALVYAGEPWARRNILIKRAARYMLQLSERLLAMDEERVRKILIHEAVHIGYRGHGDDFRELVRQFGSAVSESAVDNPKVRVEYQSEKGKRFVVVPGQEFDTEAEAIAWAKAERVKTPGRYRLLMGLEGEGESGDSDDTNSDDLGTLQWNAEEWMSWREKAGASKEAGRLDKALRRLHDVLFTIGDSFVPNNTNRNNLIDLSFDSNFVLPPEVVPSATITELRNDALIAWQELNASPGFNPGDNELLENPDAHTIPQPLVEWIRLVMPKWFAARDLSDKLKPPHQAPRNKIAEMYEDDADLIWHPQIAFSLSGYTDGRPWSAFYLERPEECSREWWAEFKAAYDSKINYTDELLGTTTVHDNIVLSVHKLLALVVGTESCTRKMQFEHPHETWPTNTMLGEVWERLMGRLDEFSQRLPLVLISDDAPPLTYEMAMAEFKAARDAFIRSKLHRVVIDDKLGPIRESDTKHVDITMAQLKRRKFYIGLPEIDYDKDLRIVPPLFETPAVELGYQLVRPMTVMPYERPRLVAGINVMNRGVEVDAGILEDAADRKLMRSGFTATLDAFHWDWKAIFERYREDDDERLERLALNEFDALCWAQSTGMSKKEALEWLERHDAKRIAQSLQTGKGTPTPWPTDWSSAEIVTRGAGPQMKIGVQTSYGQVWMPPDLPPKRVRIALGQRIRNCGEGGDMEHTQFDPADVDIVPLWFHLALRENGISTGDDWIGRTRLQLFDWLWGLYSNNAFGFLLEKSTSSAGRLDTAWHTLYKQASAQGRLKPDTIEAARVGHTPIMRLGEEWTFLPLTMATGDCTREVGSRRGRCYRYDAARDLRLMTVLPDGKGRYVAVREGFGDTIIEADLFKEVP